MYGILRALSDEPINRQRQKRSFRLICRLSIQHIRCVEQRSAYRCLHSVLRARPGKTLHRTVLFPPASSPVRLNQTQRHPTGASVFGAGGGTLRSNRPLLALRAARSDCFRSPAGQNAPQDRFFPRLRVPFDLTKHRGTQRVPLCLVPVVGLEPTRYCYQRILSPSRLPIPSHRRMCSNFVHISV